MRCILVGLLVASTLALQAQAGISKIYNLSPYFDAAGKILPAPGGNFMMFGKLREDTTTYNHNLFLQLVDATGNPIWQKSYGTAGVDEGGIQGLARCQNGWVMVANRGQIGWMVRVNEQGTVLWATDIQYPNAPNLKMSEVATLPSGGFIASGYYGGCSGLEMLAVRVSENGLVEWIHDYTDGEAYAMCLSEAGEAFFMVGENKILKIRASSGNLSWMKTIDQSPFGPIGNGTRMKLSDVVNVGENRIAVAGTLLADNGVTYKSAFYLAGWTEFGQFDWENTFNESILDTNTGSSDIASHSALTYLPNSQNLLLSGLINGKMKVVRTTSNGKVISNLFIGPNRLIAQPYMIKHGDGFVAAGGISEGFGNISTWFYRSPGNVLEMQQPNLTAASLTGVNAKLWPNPTNGQATLMLQIPEPTETPFYIFSRTGQLVHTWNVQLFEGENQLTLDADLLPAGFYFIKSAILPALPFVKQ
jgi:hypothetical protein